MTFFAFTKDMSDTGGFDVVPGSPDSFQFNGRITGYRDNGSALRVMGPRDPLDGGADIASYSGIFHSAGYDLGEGINKTRYIIGANIGMDMELQAPHQLRLVGNDNTQTDGQVWMASHTNVVISPRGVDSVNCRRLIIDRVDKVNFDDLNTSDVEISVNQGNIRFASVPVLPTYTTGTLPSVVAGGMIFVSDAAAGVGRIAYGNTAAAAWIDPQTGSAVAV